MEHGSHIDPLLVARVRRVHWFAATLLVALSSLALVYWLLGRPAIQPGGGMLEFGQMKFNVALGLLLGGIALHCLQPGARPLGPRIAMAAGVAIAILGMLSLLQDLLDIHLGIDELFVADTAPPPLTAIPGRMSANTALSFMLGGLALAVADRLSEQGRRPAEWLALASTVPAFLALIGRGFGLQEVAGLFETTSMSIYTAFGLLLLATGTLTAQPLDGGMRWLVTRAPEGAAARMLLPGSIVLTMAIGGLAALGRNLGLYGSDTGNALLFVLGICIFFFLLTRAVARLARVEDKRRAAIDELQRREEKLRFVTHAADIGEWDWDIHGGRLDWSLRCRSIFGLDATTDLDYQRFLALVHPDDRNRVNNAVRTALDHGHGYDIEFRVRRADGNERWIHSRGSATFGRDGRPLRMGGVVLDITEFKLTEEKLNRERSHLRAVIDNTTALIAIRDLGANLVLANRAVFALPGAPSPEQALGCNIDECFPSEIAGVLNGSGPPGQPRNARSRMERTLCHEDGSCHVYITDTFPVIEEDNGQCFGICTISTDISDIKRLEEALRLSEQRFRELADSAPSMLWVVDASGEDSFVSRAWYEFTGQKQERGEDPCSILAAVIPDDHERVAETFHAAFLSREDFECEFRVRRQDGRFRWLLNRGRARFDADGAYVGFVGSLIDITERKEAEEHIRKTALHDPLTGLPNRALVFEYGGHSLAGKQRSQGEAALLFIDLDRFKPINDTYGHEAGDHVLKEVARRLKECTRKADLLGRLGGDEFVILLSHMASGSERDVAVARHVQEAISRPIPFNGVTLDVTPSIGIARFPEHGTDLDSLLRCADLAMYQAKQSGRANYHLYTHDLDRRAEEALRLENRLRNALRNNTLALHYQPVVDTETGRLAAAEALLRLADNGPPAAPAEFIPVAEACGLINELGEWVAAEACRQQARWQAQGLPPLTVAINVSPLQFRQRGFAERIGDIVLHSGVDPRTLQLEVTESSVMEAVDEAIQILERIKALGIRVALDDFGTGHSSLSLLGELPLDKIKIDQVFIRRVELDQSSMAVTQAIIALAHTLELELVGEGVESANALAYLRSSGCQQAQGYYISPPLPAERFSEWRRLH